MIEVKESRYEPKLKPLEQWICDHCGKLIASPPDGWLEWFSEPYEPRGTLLCFKAHGFRIVHHLLASPLGGEEGCYDRRRISGDHLDHFMGIDGLAKFMSILGGPTEIGVKNLHEFGEILRRLMFPYYEEARQYWDQSPYWDGASAPRGAEMWGYLDPKVLRRVIEAHWSGEEADDDT